MIAGTLALVVITAALATGAFVAVYAHYASQLPPAEQIVAAEEDAFLTTEIYERTGQTVIYEVIDPNGGDRRWVSLDDDPPVLTGCYRRH